MADVNEAVRCVTTRVAAGSDAIVCGDASLARLVMHDPALEQLGEVIPVLAETGELSLSSLIAQLSGETDLGGQDDSVLELGFRRLTGPGRTILVVQAPQGIGRTALRYMQHMTRLAPRLSLVVSGSAALDALLAEPGFAALRTRLEAAPAIVATEAPATLAPPQSAGPLVAVATVPMPRRATTRWMATALTAAAVAGVAWFSYGATRGASPAFASVPVQLAVVLPPPLAVAANPSRAAVPAPVLASARAPALATRPAIDRAEPPVGTRDMATILPPLAAPQHPVLAAALPLPPLLKPAPTSRPRRQEARTEMARLPRRYPEWSAPPPYDEPDRYAYAPSYPEPTPAWVRREARRREAPYLGTFAVDPYGMRVFRYDP